MHPTAITVTEAVRNFSDYINRIAYRGERFVLIKGKKAVAELRPVPAGRCLGELADLLASLPRLSLEEAEAFAEDISCPKEEFTEERLRDPWASC